MRHRDGSWKPASTAECPAGVTRSPRPGHRVFQGIVGVIVAAHAAFIAMQWQGGSKKEAAKSARMSMRLVSAPARSAEAAREQHGTAKPEAPAATQVARLERKSTPRKSSDTPRPLEQHRDAPVMAPAEAAPPPIVGVAFGLPRIGTPGGASARWMKPASEQQPQGPPPAMLMQMQAARAAGLAQIADALLRELGSWQTPEDQREAACALSAEPDSRLSCDDDKLLATISPREAALSGLLRAYRSLEPKTTILSIALVQGRYQAAWNAQ